MFLPEEGTPLTIFKVELGVSVTFLGGGGGVKDHEVSGENN